MVFMSWDPLYSGAYGSYSRYGYGYANGYGYGGFWPTYYYQGRPVVITRPSGSVDVPERDTRGRMVRGSGYTRPAGRDGGSSGGTPRTSTSDGGSRSTGSSSPSGGDRTAKPRP
jgi:hypothetical protein